MMKTYAMLLFTVVALPFSAFAQGAPEPGNVTVAERVTTGGPKMGLMGAAHLESADVESVKGTPFCANVTNEHTQTFADGNRIHTTESSLLCRDSEGRTRRESSLNLLGAAAQKPTMKLITIVDPVAGYRYLLDTNTKVARKMPLFPKGALTKLMPPPPGANGKGAGDVMYFETTTGPGPGALGPEGGARVFVNRDIVIHKSAPDSNEPAPATENLGDQTIDGVHATGTRVTTTIPAGTMGNEQPILVTSENWYSPELKATVLTKHNDPWAGELKTQFTNVSTNEPDASLFTVPPDYQVVDDKEGPVTIRLKQAPESK
jgi:hypothetical protein